MIIDSREEILHKTLNVIREFKKHNLNKLDISDFPTFNYKPFWRQKFINENGFINKSVEDFIGEISVPFSLSAKRFSTLPSSHIRELKKNSHIFSEGEIFISSDIRKSSSLNEMGITKSYPINKSFGYLNDIFKQLCVKANYFINGKYCPDIYSYSGEEGLVVILIDEDKISSSLSQIVEEVAPMCGYFIVYEGLYDLELSPRKFYGWQIEPIHQINIAKEIGRYLYHATPANKLDKIKKKGLTVDKSSSFCKVYRGRTYFFTEDNEELFRSYIDKSKKPNIIGDGEEDGKFAILTIDREKCPDIKLFQDLQYRGEPAVYTYSYIPSEAIIDVEIIETFEW